MSLELTGLAIPFGGPFAGRDSYGTFFSPRTDLAIEPDAPIKVWYQHGLDDALKFTSLGTATVTRTDAAGVWVRAVLKDGPWLPAIRTLLDEGMLGYSAGSSEHSYREDPRTGELLAYPVHEISLTPAQSNPWAIVTSVSDMSAVRIIGSGPVVRIIPSTPPPVAVRVVETRPGMVRITESPRPHHLDPAVIRQIRLDAGLTDR